MRVLGAGCKVLEQGAGCNANEGRPGLPPGRYFRLLLIGYFEGLDAERAIAWGAAHP